MSEGATYPQGQLRQRRAHFLQSHAREEREQQQVKKSLRRGSDVSAYMLKFYIVVGTAIILTLVAVLNHIRPKFLFGKPKAGVPPFRFISIYPPGITIESDLPRFFRTYSVATPQNERARMAVIKMVNSRKVLRQRSGSYKTYLKTWDASSASILIERRICGSDFEAVYMASSAERKNDLVSFAHDDDDTICIYCSDKLSDVRLCFCPRDAIWDRHHCIVHVGLAVLMQCSWPGAY